MAAGTTHLLSLSTAPLPFLDPGSHEWKQPLCCLVCGGGWEVRGDPVPQEECPAVRRSCSCQGWVSKRQLYWAGLGFSPPPPLTCLCNQVHGIEPRLVVPGVEVEGEGEGLPPPHDQLPAARLSRVVPIGVLRAMPIHKGQLQLCGGRVGSEGPWGRTGLPSPPLPLCLCRASLPPAMLLLLLPGSSGECLQVASGRSQGGSRRGTQAWPIHLPAPSPTCWHSSSHPRTAWAWAQFTLAEKARQHPLCVREEAQAPREGGGHN